MLVPLLTVAPVVNVVPNPLLNLAFELLLARLRLSKRLQPDKATLVPFPEPITVA
jgi:hypothetical protein